MKRVALITGTSSGIGLAVAVDAARAGYQTIATMRDTARSAALLTAAEAAGVEVEVRRLDVVDRASVAGTVSEVVAEHGRLDVVVNNAGQGHVGTVEVDSVDDFRRMMEINFFGVVQVTKAVMPHLRESGGRLVTVSSVGGVIGQPFNEAYCAAKFAVEGMMESLAPLAAAHGVRITVVEPGAVRSSFVANAGRPGGADVSDAGASAGFGIYAEELRHYLRRASAAFSQAQTPDEVAGRVMEVLASDAPPFRLQTSRSAREFVALKLADVDGESVTGATARWLS
ncbi:SDR family oxidoreductase [Lentzea sp. HUAS12]|uniref:SDR family oxidoreductase n=1 Tax=Lentzea sp. HUAS12 TaxID=2951806 RepID=UPI0020A01FE1|nr:SDR family oxidoreductase [Lentzea sp. HUAS12]USX54035.1 SDR family oxidoreductase [Lentzea sp. HUAS12]